jgi:hypothetical protein
MLAGDLFHLLLDALVHIAEVRFVQRPPLVTSLHDRGV